MGDRTEGASAWISEHKGSGLGVLVATFVVVGIALALNKPGQRPTFADGSIPNVVTSLLPKDEQAALKAAELAYGAWSAYTTSGDTVALGEAFVKDGPQYRRLIADYKMAAASATQTNLVMLEPKVLSSEIPGTRTVRAEVKVEQAGVPVRYYQFDMIMQRGADKVWRAFDVAAGKAPVPSSSATAP